MLTGLGAFFRRETVLSLACLLAAGSCFFTPPSRAYLGYLDGHTLVILFCLMAVMAALQDIGTFRALGGALLGRIRTERQLAAVLTALCFFGSMAVTNDVALLTFVPFGVLLLSLAGMEGALCFTVTLMTIAANLGSMLTPIGNPQNLYLYGVSGLSLGEFVATLLPYTALAGLLLALCVVLGFRGAAIPQLETAAEPSPPWRVLAYDLALFGLCLLGVAKVMPVWLLLAVILAAVWAQDRRLLRRVDYSLLATFVCLFVFIGNLRQLSAFRDLAAQLLEGRVRLAAVAVSQVISNVPAALLLSGFTAQWRELLIGTNLGGLGTLIASMASLISYKQIARHAPASRGRYLRTFTAWNLLFLAALLALPTG